MIAGNYKSTVGATAVYFRRLSRLAALLVRVFLLFPRLAPGAGRLPPLRGSVRMRFARILPSQRVRFCIEHDLIEIERFRVEEQVKILQRFSEEKAVHEVTFFLRHD